MDAPRRFFGDKHWAEPLKWNREALQKFGRAARVFCASMADIFEDRAELEPHRQRLMQLVHGTPYLDWLLLTKRHMQLARYGKVFTQFGNARLGVTVENQTYDFRITPDVEWISYEPALGPLAGFVPGKIRWLIIGGESGAGAREMKMEWALEAMQRCRALNIAIHFKQTGDVLARKLGLKDKSGKDPSEWPTELKIQEFPAWQNQGRN